MKGVFLKNCLGRKDAQLKHPESEVESSKIPSSTCKCSLLKPQCTARM